MSTYRREIPKLVHRTFTLLEGNIQDVHGVQHQIQAQIELANSGEVVIRGSVVGPPPWLYSSDSFNMTLMSRDGWTVHCEHVLITSYQRPHFKASPTCVTAKRDVEPKSDKVTVFAVFSGGDNIFCGDQSDDQNSRTVIEADFIGRNAWLYGAPICGLEKEIGYCQFDATHSLDADWAILDRLCSLLSLAYTRFISVPWYCRFDQESPIFVRLVSSGFPGTAGNTLYVTHPAQISDLIRNAWQRWGGILSGLNVTRLINQYILTRGQEFIEASLILGSIWMEALKYQYAKNIKRYKQDSGGYFLKPSGKPYGFKELLEEAFEHFGVAPPSADFITKVRNPIIHNGTLSISLSEQIEEKYKMVETIEAFLLKVLDFQGLRWDRKQDKWS